MVALTVKTKCILDLKNSITSNGSGLQREEENVKPNSDIDKKFNFLKFGYYQVF